MMNRVSKIWIVSIFALQAFSVGAQADAICDFAPGSLMRYEREILKAAEAQNFKKMAQPLACILQMQSDSEGFARYLSHSFLRPLLGGAQIGGVPKDPRYKVVSQVLEQLALKADDGVQKSFVTEFSRGEWRFYTLFCEKGNTDHCSDFLPDEIKVKDEAPILAAASMLRLRKAYQVLKGPQRDLIAQRLKNLHRDIPKTSALQRKFIDQIYEELFSREIPLSWLS